MDISRDFDSRVNDAAACLVSHLAGDAGEIDGLLGDRAAPATARIRPTSRRPKIKVRIRASFAWPRSARDCGKLPHPGLQMANGYACAVSA